MPDITIPPEALEAGARKIADATGWGHPLGMPGAKKVARACFQAMVKAWPGMLADQMAHEMQPKSLILPLPQEKTDGE